MSAMSPAQRGAWMTICLLSFALFGSLLIAASPQQNAAADDTESESVMYVSCLTYPDPAPSAYFSAIFTTANSASRTRTSTWALRCR